METYDMLWSKNDREVFLLDTSLIEKEINS